jgi:transcriptional regulator with GAF, ATPase, and Fis domain/CHASE2 domain-containing sensor protein
VQKIADTKKIIALLLAIMVGILSLPLLPWNTKIRNQEVAVLFKIRGQRPFNNDFFFIYIGQKDIDLLGGWPITRDYHGFLHHVLSKLHTKVTGHYILFDSPDSKYPEYDKMLAELLKNARNVVLPMALTQFNLDKAKSEYVAGGLRVPGRELHDAAAAVGFSNLGPEIVKNKVPIVASHNGQTYYSFGVELAAQYLQTSIRMAGDKIVFTDLNRSVSVDKLGQLRINYSCDASLLPSMSLLDLLNLFEANPDSLDLTGKIAILDVTAEGIASLDATPLGGPMPRSLIHAQVADNLISDTWLREFPPAAVLVIVLLVGVIAMAWSQMTRPILRITTVAAFWGCYLVVVFLLFSSMNLILPVTYPLLAFLIVSAQLSMMKGSEQIQHHHEMRSELMEEIARKQKELSETRHILEAAAADQQVVAEQQRKIAELEDQLRDLEIYADNRVETTQRGSMNIIHAENSPMKEVLNLIAKVADDDIPILLLGETGTGKELVAEAIHCSGKRKDKPSIAINCGALTETLLESELFGHEKGSFTGAHARRKGRFELANGGTIFLDEITETTAQFQSRLLRVLQEHTFERIGGEETIEVDVRIIAASNRDIESEVNAGRFRQDLYYRLKGFPIELPALRDRVQDIPILVRHFLEKYDQSQIQGASNKGMVLMKTYGWPGNVRELENVVRRAAILAQSSGRRVLQEEDLPPEIRETSKAAIPANSLEQQILHSLRRLEFSRSAITMTARALGKKDRGTVTEYFRGICFQHLVATDFDIEKAAREISDSDDEGVVVRVREKIEGYLRNLYPLPDEAEMSGNKIQELPAQYHGLPKKYHAELSKIISRLRNDRLTD